MNTDIKMEHVEIISHGQIELMTFPAGWIEGPPHKFSGGAGSRSFREVHLRALPDVAICFYYRGLPCSDEAGNSFRQILDQPPHNLTSAETKLLDEILGDKAHPEHFTRMVCRTEDFNGKRILMVEGRYKEAAEDTMELFVDAAGDGRVIQEIYYHAPKDKYLRYLLEAKSALKSIQWK